jgi:hypothetical protein
MRDAAPPPQATILGSLPDPERIRDRLSALFAEARLLRRLLRVAVDASQERGCGPAAGREVSCHAAG